ncbi:MAG TPA: sulfite exporter TauE/SafE family protein [Myxococcota bacterium]
MNGALSGPEAIAQLVGVGVLWMSVHCVGMCGPLLLGLDVPGTARGTSSTIAGMGRMLAYQAGRAVTYAIVGAVAGLVGAGLEAVSTMGGAVLAVLLGVVAIGEAFGLHAWWSKRTAPVVTIGAPPSRSPTTTLVTLLKPVLLSTHPARPFVLGLVLGFLPCMIALWALGLAALTSSPLWGALVMLSLVALTTPLLVSLGALSSLLRRIPGGVRRLWQRGATLLAGVWLLLVGLAALDVIEHAHLPLRLFGRGFTLMLF